MKLIDNQYINIQFQNFLFHYSLKINTIMVKK